MFASWMINSWIVCSLVAVVGGAVGFFIVMRGQSFVAHAIPNGSFAGAAGASLISVSPLWGLGVFSLLGVCFISLLSRRGRGDVAIALTLVLMLACGALFLSFSSEYSPAIFSLLFGEVLGVSPNELIPTLAMATICLAALATIWRPLLYASILPENYGHSKAMGFLFLLMVALATTAAVPVVGTTLIFSLLIGPAATGRNLTSRPLPALAISMVLALVIVWLAIGLSFQTNWPIGFFVGSLSALFFGSSLALKSMLAKKV